MKIILKRKLYKLLKVGDMNGALKPLLLCLNIFGMLDIDLKKHPLKCLRIIIMISLYSLGCIMLLQDINYDQIYKGYAIEIIGLLIEIFSGILSVIVFYLSRIGKSHLFRKWYESIKNIDNSFQRMETFVDFHKTAQTILAQVSCCVLNFTIIFVSLLVNTSWNFITAAGFLFPMAIQALFYCEYFNAFLLILQRLEIINEKLYKHSIKSEYVERMLSCQVQLINMSEEIVRLNGPTDICTRLISLIITVFGFYGVIFNNNDTTTFALLVLPGIILNHLSTFMFLRISQRCVTEVCNTYKTHLFYTNRIN